MFKFAVLIQTILLSFSTDALIDFNVSLYFPSHFSVNNVILDDFSADYDSSSAHKANDLALNNLPYGSQSISLEELSLLLKQKKASDKIQTIVLDPGHGGHDPGCLGKKSREKHIALAIAKKLAAAINKAHPDIKVILTRDKDVFIPLHKRAAIANRNNADLFISIHCNSMPPGNGHVHGTETYVMGLHTAQHNLDVAKRENAAILLEADYEKNYDYDPNSPEGHILLSIFQNAYLEQSILFAEKVENQFKAITNRKSRGVKQAGFVVLKETTMPSVLIETGFLSNTKEENYLYTKKGQNEVAAAILEAFSKYKKEVENNIANNVRYDNVEIKTEPVAVNSSQVIPPKANEVYTTINEPKSYEYNPPPTKTTNTVSIPEQSKELKPDDIFKPSTAGTEEIYTTYPGLHRQEEKAPRYNVPAEYTVRHKGNTNARGHAATKNVSIDFRVQLAASPYVLNTNTPKWQNTGYLIEIIQEQDLYKYQARKIANLHEAMEAKAILRQRGFSDAFIVAYQNGQRISMNEAKRQLGLK
jgi:N-acetylmuramoyl-L-alanine amidase